MPNTSNQYTTDSTEENQQLKRLLEKQIWKKACIKQNMKI